MQTGVNLLVFVPITPVSLRNGVNKSLAILLYVCRSAQHDCLLGTAIPITERERNGIQARPE